MTKPDRREVLHTPGDANPGGSPSSSPSSSGASANQDSCIAGDSKGSPVGSATPGNGRKIHIEDTAEAAENSKAAQAQPDTEGADGEVVEATVEPSTDELVAAAQAETAEWKDKYMRLHAEWDTYRRRMNEQREMDKACATEKLVESLLPVIDDFERTIDYAEKNGEAGLLGGVEAVHTKLIDTLTKDGVQILNPLGEAFDALEAQAIGAREDTSVPDETVAEVYQKGYKMGSKVLRPAMVMVATGGPKREVPQDGENK